MGDIDFFDKISREEEMERIKSIYNHAELTPQEKEIKVVLNTPFEKMDQKQKDIFMRIAAAINKREAKEANEAYKKRQEEIDKQFSEYNSSWSRISRFFGARKGGKKKTNKKKTNKKRKTNKKNVNCI